MNVVPFTPKPKPAPQPPPAPAAARYARAARAPATHRAYESDWRAWSDWCGAAGIDVDGAGDVDVAAYLADRADAGAAPSTIARAAAGIRGSYKARGAPAPHGAHTEAVIRGIRRACSAPVRRAAPITADMLRAMLDALPAPAGMADKRDRALLALAWQAALRRAELISLDWRDWQEGIATTITLRRSKGARDGAAVTIPIIAARRAGACPIRTMRTLARATARADSDWRAGPVFRSIDRYGRPAGRLSAQSVTAIVRRRAGAAGIPTDGISAHSLRAGMITSAAAAGASTWRLMEHSRHRQSQTLDAYIRDISLLKDHPARGLI